MSTRVFAAMDIGTNSIRLAVVEIQSGFAWSTLSSQKQVVRLGEGEFSSNTGKDDMKHGHSQFSLTPEAIERGALVCARFAEIARGYKAHQIVALATAAAREADNQDEFVHRVRALADLDVRVISGHEEARLIFLGVSSGVEIAPGSKALFMDIGGGSTELIVGDGSSYSFLDSLRMGAIRVTSQFVRDPSKPVTPAVWSAMQQHVRSVLAPAGRAIAAVGFSIMYGSSGTIINLAEIAAHLCAGPVPKSFRNYSLTLTDIQAITKRLCSLNIEQRSRIPGINPERADIILGGAAILQTVMETVGASEIRVSDRGLREGIIVDHLSRVASPSNDFEHLALLGARRRSIQQLMRSTGVDEAHAEHIKSLALSLFDQWKGLGLHDYDRARELLEYASLLHDCGFFVSHTDHQQHSYYLIRHSELLGFDDLEVEIMANIALYHRKANPRKRHANFAKLDGATQQLIRVLSCALRFAEALDRGHLMLVTGVTCARLNRPERIQMTLRCSSEAQLEVWAAQGQAQAFTKTFNLPLQISSPDLIVH